MLAFPSEILEQPVCLNLMLLNNSETYYYITIQAFNDKALLKRSMDRAMFPAYLKEVTRALLCNT